MPRKVYDIKPPHCVNKGVLIENKKNPPWGLMIVILSIFLLIGGYFFFCQATVEVDLEVFVDGFREEEEINWEGPPLGVITSQVFDLNRTAKNTFASTGEVKEEHRARGTIRIFNSFSSTPQTLIATTRFVSSTEHLFRVPEKVTVPGYTHEGGKMVPGYVDVEVVAAEPGADYNIEASKFSLPGLAGTAQYTTIYAESYQPMTGGSMEASRVATAQDLEKAEAELLNNLRDSEDEYFQQFLPEGWVAVNDGVRREIVESKADEGGDEFEYSVEMNLQVLAVQEEDVDKWILQRVLSEEQPPAIFTGQEIKDLDLTMTLTQSDWSNGVGLLRLEGRAETYMGINKNQLASFIRGKTRTEAKQELESFEEIKRANIRSRIFWSTSLPSDCSRITVKEEV